MKKIIVVILFSFFSFEVEAQTYPIPGATQQPAWVFPFFIEDAHGNKDTVYIGYDSQSSQCFCPGDDSVFGERWFELGVDNFHGFTYESISIDSGVKVNILPDLGPNDFYFLIGAWNAYYPIKFSWDVSLLRSDSIPFPDQDPLPRAQINLEWYLGANTLHTATCGSNPIVITDTAQASCFCQYRDSIVIYNFFNDTSRVYMNVLIQVTQWSGMNLVGVKEINKPNKTNIYPIPANDYLTVNNFQSKFRYEIIDSKAFIIKSGNVSTSDAKIFVADIPSGFYIIRLYYTDTTTNIKVIIQH